MSVVPPPPPALAGGQGATWGSCPGAARSSEGDAVVGDGAGTQRCAPAGSTARAWELPRKCTFFVVSLSRGARRSPVLATRAGTAGSQLPLCGGLLEWTGL